MEFCYNKACNNSKLHGAATNLNSFYFQALKNQNYCKF